MKLIIVRHGETIQNAKGIVQGHMHGKLSKKGIAQAKELALLLKGQKIDVIFSSDLLRAVHTAKHITKYHKAPTYYTKELREINRGVFQGIKVENLKEIINSSNVPTVEFKPKGGESYLEVIDRLNKFYKKISKKYKNKTVLIVTHGVATKTFMSTLLKMPIEKSHALRTKNAGMLVIEIKKSGNKKIKDTMFISS